MPPRYRRARRPPGPRGAVDEPPLAYLSQRAFPLAVAPSPPPSGLLFCRQIKQLEGCEGAVPPGRRGNSPVEDASRHAPSRLNTPPTPPSLCAEPPVAVVPRRTSLVVVGPRRSLLPAGVAPHHSLCSTGRPRVAAVPARAPSGARKPSRGLSGTQRRAPTCPSLPGSFTWRPMLSSVI